MRIALVKNSVLQDPCTCIHFFGFFKHHVFPYYSTKTSYWLEAPLHGTSNVYSQHVFVSTVDSSYLELAYLE